MRTEWPIWTFFILLFLVSYLCLPFAEHLRNDTEIFLPYANYIDLKIIPGFHNKDLNNFSLLFIISYFIKSNFGTSGRLLLFIYRIILFFLLGIGFLDLTLLFSKMYILQLKHRKLFISVALLLFIFDWNNSYLLIGDAYRSLFGQVFFFFFLVRLFTKNYFGMAIFALLSIFCHWGYLALYPLTLLLYQIALHLKLKRYMILGIPLVALILGFTYKEFCHYHYLPIYEKIENSVLQKGFLDGFLYRPGVLLASVIHFFCIGLLWKKVEKINIVPFAKFCAITFLFIWGLSKFGVVLNENFIEPNRLYIIFSPFMCILLAYLLYDFEIKKLKWSMLIYLGINFTHRNLSKGATPFWDIILKSDYKILFHFMRQSHGVFLTVFSFLFLFIYIYFKMKVYRKEKELTFTACLISEDDTG